MGSWLLCEANSPFFQPIVISTVKTRILNPKAFYETNPNNRHFRYNA